MRIYDSGRRPEPDGPFWKQVNEILLAEQGFLCAYTMMRIETGTMQKEHFLPSSKHPERKQDMTNLLAVCNGGKRPRSEGNSWKKLYADARKAHFESKKEFVRYLKNPKSAEFESQKHLIEYTEDGEIFCKDTMLENELVDTRRGRSFLNLNAPELAKGRRAAWQAMKEALDDACGSPEWTSTEILRQIERCWRRDQDGRFLEYRGFLISQLKRAYLRLASASAPTRPDAPPPHGSASPKA